MSEAVVRDFSRSQAVLIGTWHFRYLERVPAAEHSLARMYGLLTGVLCGWPADRVLVADNRETLGDLPNELVKLLRPATDVALFYYVGHGQYDNEDRLCLALQDSHADSDFRTTTSLTFDAVRHAFNVSKAHTKIAILDCCFAGLAAGREGRLGSERELPRSPGFYLMMASGESSTAWFERAGTGRRGPQTYFTKYLADIIERGLPGMPNMLSLGTIYDALADALVRDGKPEPGSRGSNKAAQYLFARNAAAVDHLVLLPAQPVQPLSPRLDAPQPHRQQSRTNPALLLRHTRKHPRAVLTAVILLVGLAGTTYFRASSGDAAKPTTPVTGSRAHSTAQQSPVISSRSPSPTSHTITYNVTAKNAVAGTNSTVSISYSDETGTIVKLDDQNMPWSLTITTITTIDPRLFNVSSAYLMAQVYGDASATCQITVDGHAGVQHSSGSGDPIALCQQNL